MVGDPEQSSSLRLCRAAPSVLIISGRLLSCRWNHSVLAGTHGLHSTSSLVTLSNFWYFFSACHQRWLYVPVGSHKFGNNCCTLSRIKHLLHLSPPYGDLQLWVRRAFPVPPDLPNTGDGQDTNTDRKHLVRLTDPNWYFTIPSDPRAQGSGHGLLELTEKWLRLPGCRAWAWSRWTSVHMAELCLNIRMAPTSWCPHCAVQNRSSCHGSGRRSQRSQKFSSISGSWSAHCTWSAAAPFATSVTVVMAARFGVI